MVQKWFVQGLGGNRRQPKKELIEAFPLNILTYQAGGFTGKGKGQDQRL